MKTGLIIRKQTMKTSDQAVLVLIIKEYGFLGSQIYTPNSNQHTHFKFTQLKNTNIHPMGFLGFGVLH